MTRRIVLAMVAGVLGGIVVGVLLRGDSISCDEWQEEYARVDEEGSGGVFTHIGLGPIAERLRELEAERPEDCPKPPG